MTNSTDTGRPSVIAEMMKYFSVTHVASTIKKEEEKSEKQEKKGYTQ